MAFFLPAAKFLAAFDLVRDLLVDDVDRQIVGSNGDDTIRGSVRDDLILGLDGDDAIHGRFGADRILGGEGNDSVSGGAGRDDFGFAAGDSAGADTILDFDIHRDQFVLDAESFGFAADEELKFQNVARVGGEDDNVDAGLDGLDTGNNTYVLQGIWNNAGQAAQAVVDAGEADDFFFAYYNVNLDVNRLFHFDQEDGLSQIANLGEAGALTDAEGNPVDDAAAIADLARLDEGNLSFDFDELFA